MIKTKVRFHLGLGKNYMKWQVKRGSDVFYFDPSTVSLEMINCKLKNQQATAQKIHDGANKTVCAWIECEDINVKAAAGPSHVHLRPPEHFYFFNPKRRPFWFNEKFENMDNQVEHKLMTVGRLVVKPL